VIVTHDLRTVKAAANAAMLDEGKIILEGSYQDFENSTSPFVTEFVKQSFSGVSHV
jgi:ABC-type transporter Mla maintaining outer membrane lipid asymmetry ATPase subunit MlaF